MKFTNKSQARLISENNDRINYLNNSTKNGLSMIINEYYNTQMAITRVISIYMRLRYEEAARSHSLEDQVMAGFVTGVCTVNSFDGLPIKIPVSNSYCNWLHSKIYTKSFS